MIEKLILGTVQLGVPYGINNNKGKPLVEVAERILSKAEESGIETLDTARAYGNAMEIIGNYHLSNKYRFKIINKFHSNNDDLELTINNELENLNIERFEAYLFHSFADFERITSQTIITILELKRKKLILKIGVSVYGNDQLEKAIESDLVDVIQLPYNLLDNEYQRGKLIRLAKSRGKEIHVRSIFLQGLFFMKESSIPSKISPLMTYLKKLNDIANTEDLSLHQLALSYVFFKKYIDKILIGVETVEQLIVNIEMIYNLKKINLESIKKIDNINVIETDLLSPINWK